MVEETSINAEDLIKQDSQYVSNHVLPLIQYFALLVHAEKKE